MNTSLLKVGDIVFLENGMTVYGNVPEKFVTSNRRFSNELTKIDVVIGKILHNETRVLNNMESIVSGIIHSFEYQGAIVSTEDAMEFVMSKVKKPVPEIFVISQGKYLVTKSISDGGSTAMFKDVYPDGHHVFCKAMNGDSYDENGTEVNFYQTGCFTAMIPNITPIGTMKLTFV